MLNDLCYEVCFVVILVFCCCRKFVVEEEVDYWLYYEINLGIFSIDYILDKLGVKVVYFWYVSIYFLFENKKNLLWFSKLIFVD